MSASDGPNLIFLPSEVVKDGGVATNLDDDDAAAADDKEEGTATGIDTLLLSSIPCPSSADPPDGCITSRQKDADVAASDIEEEEAGDAFITFHAT